MLDIEAMVLPDKIDHIGVLVKDIDETTKFLSSLWGLGPWTIIDFIQEDDVVLVGGRTRQKVAFTKLGPTALELIQPIEGGGVWSEFIEATGGGIHHIAFNVSNWDEMVSKLQEQGGKMVAGGSYEGKRWCYFYIKPGGMIVEFMDNFGISI